MTRHPGPFLLAGTAVVLAIVPTPVAAGIYRALCTGGANCTVTLANGQIVTPSQTIAKDQVLSWSQGGGGSRSDVGLGVATTILFGLPGLLGFGARLHDYQFQINHVDGEGNPQVTTVAFVNDVPSNQFMLELMGLTGLSAGQVNKTLQSRLDQIKAAAAENARIEALDCARVLRPHACSWNAYLATNPGVQQWATRNPQLVAAEKARLRAAD